MARLFFSFYPILLLAIAAYIAAGSLIQNKLAREWLIYDVAHDYIGAFYLIDELHKRVPQEEFSELVEQWPASSNIPLAIFNTDSLALESAELDQLQQQPIWVQDPDRQILYGSLSNSNQVARLGPMGTYAPLRKLEDGYSFMLFVILALPVLIWLLYFQRKLIRLESAATQLGQGEFSVRVSEKGSHRIGRLNHTFNGMAQRIEQLIEGHKSLTNAVAHELRTPIARIRFELEMLNTENTSPTVEPYIHGISEDVDELSKLVDELLSYARFDRETSRVNLEIHSLHELLAKLLDSRYLEQNENNISIEYDSHWCALDSQLQFMPFDPAYLERAIGNIVSNAQKYTVSKILLSVKLADDHCTVIIDDDGPGIPTADRDDLFEPFKRLDDSRTRATGGYGLGLAIVKQIAQWHGGESWIEESPMGGTRVLFRWPIVDLS